MNNNFERKAGNKYLGDVLILGKGVTGNALERYLKNLDKERIKSIEVISDNDFLALKNYDLCITSPGISEFSDFFQNAKKHSKRIIGELEFAYQESEIDSKWIAITGTNGKTTTTSLVAHILQNCGVECCAVGNIGNTCISCIDSIPKTYVAEVSSYQLATIDSFNPEVGAILNITPDHLKWHKSYDNYKQAKYKIFQNMKNNSKSLLFLGDEIYKNLDTTFFKCSISTYSNNKWKSILNKMSEQIPLKGKHNIENCICAASIAKFFGLEEDKIINAILNFHPLEHRIEPVAEIDGIQFINDSKATNVDSTLKALTAFPKGNIILLLGGTDKGSDLDELVNESQKLSESCFPIVKKVICFGEAGARFYNAFSKSKIKSQDLLLVNNLKSAFDSAIESAKSGDVCLLSPACASFDEFSGFEERGKVFKEMVKELKSNLK